MPSAADLLRFIAILLVALLAPGRMLTRVRRLGRVGLWLLAKDLAAMHARGEKLRSPGDGLKTVAARIDLLVWISADPVKALAHLARRVRGWRRHRMLGRVAPPAFAPVRLWSAPLVAAPVAPAIADSS